MADELGDPPRFRRYVELAAARDDLPSGATLRVRLGAWPGIAAELTAQRAARAEREPEPARAPRASSAGSSKESIESGRLPTQVEVWALRYLGEHPGSSGTAVREGLGIRHQSQVWELLARLEREGLLVNERNGTGKAWRNAWRLSARGRSVLGGLPEGMYV